MSNSQVTNWHTCVCAVWEATSRVSREDESPPETTDAIWTEGNYCYTTGMDDYSMCPVHGVIDLSNWKLTLFLCCASTAQYVGVTAEENCRSRDCVTVTVLYIVYPIHVALFVNISTFLWPKTTAVLSVLCWFNRIMFQFYTLMWYQMFSCELYL